LEAAEGISSIIMARMTGTHRDDIIIVIITSNGDIITSNGDRIEMMDVVLV